MEMAKRGIIATMRGAAIVLLLLLAGCSRRRTLNRIEYERLSFRAENETVRAEDLEERYRRQKRKSDALSDELLALSRERDRLYGEYDELRGQLARVDHDAQAAQKKKTALAKALQKAKADVAELTKAVAQERKAVAELERQLAEARRKRTALEAQNRGTATNPG